MTEKQLFDLLKTEFIAILEQENIKKDEINVTMKTLTANEAIGETKRKDFPIITGKEVMLQAEYKGAYGQAFTDAPCVFSGNLEDICNLNLEQDKYARGLFIATLNAVMSSLNKTNRSVHCKNEGPEHCAKEVVRTLKQTYGNPKIGLIGYQPAMLESLAKKFKVRVLDLNQDNIGQIRYDVLVEDGRTKQKEVIEWADLILCTGSTLCNGTIVTYLDLEKEVLFFGTTLAGAAPILQAKRLCFADDIY